MADTVESNVVETRFCRESDLKTLPASGERMWFLLEPNAYPRFGGEVSRTARAPISATRQRRKGVVSDLAAGAEVEHDFQPDLLNRLLQSLFWARWYEQADNWQYHNRPVFCTGVLASDDSYNFTTGIPTDTYVMVAAARKLVYASGFNVAENNGLKTLASVAQTANKLIVAGSPLTDETPSEKARVRVVGRSFSESDVSVVVDGASGTFRIETVGYNMNNLGVKPGQWVFIGGDAATSNFTNAQNRGFARVRRVVASYVEFDRATFTPANSASTGNFVHIYFGPYIKNEADVADRFRHSFHFERELGKNETAEELREYVTGAVGSTFELSMPEADKVTCTLAFEALDYETNDGTQTRKSGTRAASASGEPIFNTSTDVLYAELYQVAADVTPDSVLGYLTDASLAIDNGVQKRGALGVLGGIGHSTGDFEVTMNATAYFTDMTAIQAIRANTTCGAYFIVGGSNHGFVMDFPALTLGDSSAEVAKDEPIMLTFENPAHGSDGLYSDYTLSMSYFPYLPKIAAPETSESAAAGGGDGGSFVDTPGDNVG